MPQVFTPNPAFTGRRFGVDFVNGQGVCDEKTAPLLAAAGYVVTVTPEPAEPAAVEPSTAAHAPRRRRPRKQVSGE